MKRSQYWFAMAAAWGHVIGMRLALDGHTLVGVSMTWIALALIAHAAAQGYDHPAGEGAP